jgi:hypothetical protein
MRTSRHGLALAGLAAVTAFGATAFAGTAEAHGKHRHRHGVTVILGDGYSYGYGYGYGYRSSGCSWLLARYHDSGNPKWYNRWHKCKYGW